MVLSNDLQELRVGGVTLGGSGETDRWHFLASCPNLFTQNNSTYQVT